MLLYLNDEKFLVFIGNITLDLLSLRLSTPGERTCCTDIGFRHTLTLLCDEIHGDRVSNDATDIHMVS